MMEINSDITQRKMAEQERERQHQDVIKAQAIALAELSTPFIPITDTVLVMPLIGVVDSRRAEQVIATLLKGISSSAGEIAILASVKRQTSSGERPSSGISDTRHYPDGAPRPRISGR
ncbi:hypothetical protein [Sorangium sp. So ce1151]|uniref:hypothetical protein n=1 Tax=Sorangium sp. So ce1151 TaxID=3133332 RepID=UPI003F5D7D59